MNSPEIWCVVPAAGIGSRMQAQTPKQYLPLAGKTVAQWTLERLASIQQLSGIIVPLRDHDPYWQNVKLPGHIRVETVAGGKERSDSVLNGLNWLNSHVHQDAWVLVHDMARPCVRLADINRLIEQGRQHPDGALLASPVVDTLKSQTGEALPSVDATVDRQRLWHALTPQFFPVRLLREALINAVSRNAAITDDASAIELMGGSPLLVESARDNIKITMPEDLLMAELILTAQRKSPQFN